ncbi:eukaryotic translation initiation factor 2 [Chamberlinius hualienensis]
MAEEETIFDPTLKKKKKKKKTPFNLESFQEGGPEACDAAEADEKDETAGKENIEKDEDVALDLDFSGLKKKKNKKKTFNFDDVENALPESQSGADKEESSAEREAEEGVKDTAADDDLDFNLPTKKKRKKKINLEELSAANADEEDMVIEGDGRGIDSTWFGTDRDYRYEELLTRVFDIMREKNPDMVAGEKRRFVMKPPQVVRVGTKKTSFVNFTDICKMLHRQPKHLLAFLLAELGTSGSVDGMNQLIIKGRFQQKQIENVLRRYIKEYVTCHTCHSANTILQKDTRLFFLQCESCGSRCSVASIKSGFQAVTSKRAAIRAKTN